MPEGLFDPSVAPLPGPVRAGLGAVVRVSARIRFRVRVYPTQAEADAARRLPGAFSVEERPGGGVAWPFHISVPELAHLRADALLRLQPGRFDVVQHTAALTLHTLENVWEGETPELPGSATGFLIGRHAGLALIATNYHVAREAVLRLGREGGQARWTPEATRDTRVAVGTEENGSEQASQYREVEGVQLVANASREEWQAGLDWAVLGVPGTRPGGPPPALPAPRRAGRAR